MVVVATDVEYTEARKRWADEEILKTGVGGLNVYNSLKGLPIDTPILNFGYVGSNNYPIGTELEIGECRLYHPNVDYDEPKFNIGGDTCCMTSNDFVLSTSIKEPVVFDMELAFILAMGFKSVKSIKVVSDNLNLKEYEERVEEK